MHFITGAMVLPGIPVPPKKLLFASVTRYLLTQSDTNVSGSVPHKEKLLYVSLLAHPESNQVHCTSDGFIIAYLSY